LTKRDTLARHIPAPDLAQALQQAVILMRQSKQTVMTAEMLLWAFLHTSDCYAAQLLSRFSGELGFAWADLARHVERVALDRRSERDIRFDFVTAQEERVPLGNEVLIVLDEGLALATSQQQSQCHTGHALAVMAHEKVGTVWPLRKYGITQPVVLTALGLITTPPPPMARPSRQTSQPTMTAPVLQPVQPKTKSTPPMPVYFRENLLHDLVNRLSITHKRHVVLVGAAGVGKRTLVLSLARWIAEGKGPANLKQVVEVDERALLGNAQAEIESGLRLAQGGILFVPDMARFFGGIRADFPEAAGQALQRALLSDEVVIIGTATEERYEKLLRPNALLMAHSQMLRVLPTTVSETTAILQVLRPKFEADYGLTVAAESLPEISRLAARYYTAEALPSAAVYLWHRACALAKTSQQTTLTPDVILQATSLITGLPLTHLGADERQRYLNMAEQLHQRIIGQAAAVEALSRAVKMARVGLKEPHRPIGSFLFLGPTGVGKTELAKALAEFMFGTEQALIVLDMSEYMEDSSINRLIGSPPGYVGHEAGGQLVDTVKQRPHCVVLFDEVEKASVKVFDALLQVMEEGRLTSGRGETVSFSQSVILMTSNIGGRYLTDPTLTTEHAHEAAEVGLHDHFRPEFLNRLDDIIYFHPLSASDLRAILDLLLAKERDLLASRQVELQVTDAAKNWLLKQNDHPEWGARPLRRLIQKHLREPLADYILQHEPTVGTVVKVKVKGKVLFFEMSGVRSKE